MWTGAGSPARAGDPASLGEVSAPAGLGNDAEPEFHPSGC
jgi:hypothetical protein